MKSSKSSHVYGKVSDDLEDHPKSPNQKPLFALLSIFFLLFLLLCLILRSPTHPSPSQPPSSIATVCNVTRFPSSCFSSISSLSTSLAQNPNDPKSILILSLRVSQIELSNLSSSLLTTSSHSPALADCTAQIGDALSRLNDSLSAMGEKALLTDAKINDMRTWISSAVTDLETCLDGLQETQSPALAEMKLKMQTSREYTSNSLAIAANIRVFMQRFNMSLH